MHYFSRVVIIFVLNFQLKQLTATKINTVTGIYFDVIIVFSYFFFSFFRGQGRHVRMAKCKQMASNLYLPNESIIKTAGTPKANT